MVAEQIHTVVVRSKCICRLRQIGDGAEHAVHIVCSIVDLPCRKRLAGEEYVLGNQLAELYGVLRCSVLVRGRVADSEHFAGAAYELACAALCAVDYREFTCADVRGAVTELDVVPTSSHIERAGAVLQSVSCSDTVVRYGRGIRPEIAVAYEGCKQVDGFRCIRVGPGCICRGIRISKGCYAAVFQDHRIQILLDAPRRTACATEGRDTLGKKRVAACNQVVVGGRNRVVTGRAKRVHVHEKNLDVHRVRNAVLLPVKGAVFAYSLGNLTGNSGKCALKAVHLSARNEILKIFVGPNRDNVRKIRLRRRRELISVFIAGTCGGVHPEINVRIAGPHLGYRLIKTCAEIGTLIDRTPHRKHRSCRKIRKIDAVSCYTARGIGRSGGICRAGRLRRNGCLAAYRRSTRLLLVLRTQEGRCTQPADHC